MANRKKSPAAKKQQQNAKAPTKEANAAVKTPEKKDDAVIPEVQGGRTKVKMHAKKDNTNREHSFFGGIEAAILYGAVMICAAGLLAYVVFFK
ncbi:MAG: hypothetical protein LBB59_03335 [Campylobacteraceae bacterium]|jgi:hypothetical protein|nr:hypothetical protein [Campylobacteraceae bacterium]